MSGLTSVVIPNLNGMMTLPACINALNAKAGSPIEIIVVDCGSDDGSLQWLRAQNGIRLIEEKTLSLPRAINIGFRAAGQNDVVRVHSDVVVDTEGWLRLLRDSAYSLDKAGVVGVKLLYPDDRIQCAGRHIVSGLGIHERHANLKAFQPDDGRQAKPFEADSTPGAFAYYKRDAIDKAGGIDEGYWPMTMEDDDFCLTSRFNGFKVYINPSVNAVHFKPAWSPTTQLYMYDFEGLTSQTPLPLLKSRLMDANMDYFRQKWGWHPRFPDLSEIRRLYGHTEICWQIGEPMRYVKTQWPPTVDIAIVTWNQLTKLKRCMDSLACTNYEKEKIHVYISDNGSTDGTKEYIESLKGSYPFEITIYPLAVNTGVEVGMNWAITNGSGEFVARLDDDVVLPPEWLETLIGDFLIRPYAGCAGPKLLNNTSTRDIQCGSYRMFPAIFGHDGEPDHGQADYLSRTIHVRGCCNVYRRSALKKCGLFDIRYSPSQFDDPDHHISLIHSGYEIIYDGRVSVVHELSDGAARSYAAISNTNANYQKLIGKWSDDVWMRLDRSIDMSKEGRYLPLDGNIEDFIKTLPPVGSYPQKTVYAMNSEVQKGLIKVMRYQQIALRTDGPMAEMWQSSMQYARSMESMGNLRLAESVMHGLSDMLPHWPDALTGLAGIYLKMGKPDRAELLLSRALMLSPDDAALRGQYDMVHAQGAQGSQHVTSPSDRSFEIGEHLLAHKKTSGRSSLKVLLVNTYERRMAGGDMHQMKKTRQYLMDLGLEVDMSYSASPDPRGYDILHVFNMWFPHQTLPQIKALKLSAPHTPVVMTPIYWDMSEKAWADQNITKIFLQSKGAELKERLSALPATLKNMAFAEPNYYGYMDYQREIIKHIDHLLPQSELEMQNMQRTLGMIKPFTIVRNAAETEVFNTATPDWFISEYGIKDFVITTGLVEQRKNQLMLLYALKDSGLDIVVLGRNYDMNYLRLCRKFAPKGTLFIEHLPHERLASAMKAAKIYALPSWMECASFANIEAALSGCALVVSNRTSEPEYFGDSAYYCDPSDVNSIKGAVLQADKNHTKDAYKRDRLKKLFTEQYTWKQVAEKTLEGYEKALSINKS